MKYIYRRTTDGGRVREDLNRLFFDPYSAARRPPHAVRRPLSADKYISFRIAIVPAMLSPILLGEYLKINVTFGFLCNFVSILPVGVMLALSVMVKFTEYLPAF